MPPKVDLKINKNNVFVGDRVNMECNQLSQGRPKATISWYHNNGSVLEKNEKSFIIDEIELKDAGTYKCIAQNKAGKSESKEKRIVVNEKQNPGGEGKKGSYLQHQAKYVGVFFSPRYIRMQQNFHSLVTT